MLAVGCWLCNLMCENKKTSIANLLYFRHASMTNAYDNVVEMFPLPQARALAIVPKVTASFSFFGSLYVAQDILKDPLKRARPYTRLLLGSSLFDCLVSGLGWFMSTWPVPANLPAAPPYAVGNTATCTAQGFFNQLDIIVVGYNLGLALYFMVILVHRWPDRKVKRLELAVHVTVVSFGIGTAAAGVPLTLYNNANFWCWISSLPYDCANGNINPNLYSAPPGQPQPVCERGYNAWIYRWAFFYAPLWAAIVATTFVMCRIIWYVCKVEKKSRKSRNVTETFSPQSEANPKGKKKCRRTGATDSVRQLTNQVFWQSILYCAAFYITWTFPTVLRSQQAMQKSPPYFVWVGVVIFSPFQGVFNFFVYCRPRYLRYRQKHPEMSVGQLLSRVLFKKRRKSAAWAADRMHHISTFLGGLSSRVSSRLTMRRRAFRDRPDATSVRPPHEALACIHENDDDDDDESCNGCDDEEEKEQISDDLQESDDDPAVPSDNIENIATNNEAADGKAGEEEEEIEDKHEDDCIDPSFQLMRLSGRMTAGQIIGLSNSDESAPPANS